MTALYTNPTFLQTICDQHSSTATHIHLTQCATCCFAESILGGTLPSPACVRWWGEVN